MMVNVSQDVKENKSKLLMEINESDEIMQLLRGCCWPRRQQSAKIKGSNKTPPITHPNKKKQKAKFSKGPPTPTTKLSKGFSPEFKKKSFKTNEISLPATVDTLFEQIAGEKGQHLVDDQLYTKEEIVYAYRTKTQYNEELTDQEFFDYLEQGAKIMTDKTPTFQKGEYGAKSDVPAFFMWFCQAKQGKDQINKGAMRLYLPGDRAQKFFEAFEAGGAKARWSSHFSQTGIKTHGTSSLSGHKGLGVDIPKDDLRKQTPFGLGSILMYLTIQKQDDADKVKEAIAYLKKSPAKRNEMTLSYLNAEDTSKLDNHKGNINEYEVMKTLGISFDLE